MQSSNLIKEQNVMQPGLFGSSTCSPGRTGDLVMQYELSNHALIAEASKIAGLIVQLVALDCNDLRIVDRLNMLSDCCYVMRHFESVEHLLKPVKEKANELKHYIWNDLGLSGVDTARQFDLVACEWNNGIMCLINSNVSGEATLIAERSSIRTFRYAICKLASGILRELVAPTFPLASKDDIQRYQTQLLEMSPARYEIIRSLAYAICGKDCRTRLKSIGTVQQTVVTKAFNGYINEYIKEMRYNNVKHNQYPENDSAPDIGKESQGSKAYSAKKSSDTIVPIAEHCNNIEGTAAAESVTRRQSARLRNATVAAAMTNDAIVIKKLPATRISSQVTPPTCVAAKATSPLLSAGRKRKARVLYETDNSVQEKGAVSGDKDSTSGAGHESRGVLVWDVQADASLSSLRDALLSAALHMRALTPALSRQCSVSKDFLNSEEHFFCDLSSEDFDWTDIELWQPVVREFSSLLNSRAKLTITSPQPLVSNSNRRYELQFSFKELTSPFCEYRDRILYADESKRPDIMEIFHDYYKLQPGYRLADEFSIGWIVGRGPFASGGDANWRSLLATYYHNPANRNNKLVPLVNKSSVSRASSSLRTIQRYWSKNELTLSEISKTDLVVGEFLRWFHRPDAHRNATVVTDIRVLYSPPHLEAQDWHFDFDVALPEPAINDVVFSFRKPFFDRNQVEYSGMLAIEDNSTISFLNAKGEEVMVTLARGEFVIWRAHQGHRGSGAGNEPNVRVFFKLVAYNPINYRRDNRDNKVYFISQAYINHLRQNTDGHLPSTPKNARIGYNKSQCSDV